MRYLPIPFLVFFLFLSACSSNSPVILEDSPTSSQDNIAQDWGNYTLSFDPETSNVEIEYDRDVAFHYEVTSFLAPPACGGSGCIAATLNTWDAITHIASFSVTITNPSPWTPSDVRMIFHSLGTKKIANADSFTRAFVGSIEPFIAFGKSNPNRILPAGSSSTEIVDIYWPPMSPFGINFRVSAWLWLNCQDPYQIDGMYQTGNLYPSGGSAQIGCYVRDWQNDVSTVTIDCTPINGGVNYLAHAIGDHWTQGIMNSMGAPVGTYKSLITAVSPNPQNFDLYNYLDIVVIPDPSGWVDEGTWNLPLGVCNLDLGVIGGAANPGHALMNFMDANNQCTDIVKFPGWANPPAFYATLLNLDPTNPAFQPWPVVRIDATNDAAFGWTNDFPREWLPPPPFPILNKDTYCNYDNQPKFIWTPETDDHRHRLAWYQEVALTPVDCCDTFKGDQCALYVNLDVGAVGFQGFPGADFGFDYTDQDIIWEAIFPPPLVGPDNGQVDPADVSGIDCMRTEEEPELLVYIAMEVNRRVEVFKINDIGPGPIDLVYHYMTIYVATPPGQQAQPADIELLPRYDNYEPGNGDPILCVLVDNSAFPHPPPGWGGSIWIFNALSGAMIDMIGDSTFPGVIEVPEYLDTDDVDYSIHVTMAGPFVTQYKYY